MKSETIVALSTPVGMGAISIVRLSGDDSLFIAKKLFVPYKKTEKFEDRKLNLGRFCYKDISDECLMVVFYNPHSYTGEDLVEFQIHGSVALAKKVVDAIIENGARMASEGEFTKRAFVNGKISLDKAEAVIDVINSQSESEIKVATSVMKGKLFQIVKNLQNQMTLILASLEVALDYPEHDIEYTETQKAKTHLENIKEKLENLLNNADQNFFIKNGVNVAIIGRVNSGKSSVLNAILGDERAIVTNIEGTTRDSIKETIVYNGLKMNFIDTAGLRKSDDVVENIGIEKSYKYIDEADIVLFVYDTSREFNEEEKQTLEKISKKPHIIVGNKSDLNPYSNDIRPDVLISAKDETNIEKLKQKVYDMSSLGKINFNEVCLTNARHITSVKLAIDYLTQAIKCCENQTVDIIVMEIKKSWMELGKITGETENESVIDAIFSKFCLGK